MNTTRHPLSPAEVRAGCLACLAALLAAACGGDATDPDPGEEGPGPVASVVVDPAAATLPVVDSVQLAATAMDAAGEPIPDAAFVWTSADNDIAAVDDDGWVRPRAAGVVEIRATADGVTGTADVTMTNDPPAVTLAAPADGAEFFFADAIAFSGSATDPEEGDVPDDALVWRTDLGGALGLGPSFSRSDLPVGAYALTLTATDSYGGVGEAGAGFEVVGWAAVGAADDLIACDVTSTAAGYCWGSDVSGQLGGGPDGPDLQPEPLPVAGGHAWAIIVSGFQTSCGLTTDGDAYCWGSNGFGQLGDGTNDPSDVPVLVAGGHEWITVDMFDGHGCGITTAGAAYCWGDDDIGQLGDGPDSSDPRSEPVAVVGGHAFASVDVGQLRTCGVTTDGDAYCWGEGTSGALGHGLIQHESAPVLVAGDHEWAVVGTGEGHTCGLTTAGAAYCWGRSSGVGALGDGKLDSHTEPEPVPVVGGHTFASLSVGNQFSCAATADGQAWCWGYNDPNYGNLGDGSFVHSAEPVAVAGGHVFAAVTAGAGVACALTIDGEAYCWGRGDNGALGDGTLEHSAVPVRVSNP